MARPSCAATMVVLSNVDHNRGGGGADGAMHREELALCGGKIDRRMNVSIDGDKVQKQEVHQDVRATLASPRFCQGYRMVCHWY